MTTFFSCGHEILDRQHLGVYSFLTIRKECDDLNEIYERQNEQTLLGIQIQLHITFLLDCNYVSFEPLSCVQLSGFTSWLTPDMPYELNNTKISRVMLIKALFLTEDEFIKQALEFRTFALEFGEKHGITLDREREPRKKSKQS